MTDLVIDTHTAIWYFANSPEMSALATQTIDNTIAGGDAVILATISIVEIVYLIDKGKLTPQTLTRLMQYLKSPTSSFVTQDLTEELAQTVAQIPRSAVPDMPDRIIAATALHLKIPLVTKDHKIKALQNIQTIW
ncbi:MAG: type II toxin-antitoxin system VapC family toxin [Acidobacteriota bacterium]|nr:type II toxin-antitoxin system VapC family toxin [Acidobacteriota bacterium]